MGRPLQHRAIHASVTAPAPTHAIFKIPVSRGTLRSLPLVVRCSLKWEPEVCALGDGCHSDHWRKNLPVVGERNRAYAIDLVGYGYSDKPDPRCARSM